MASQTIGSPVDYSFGVDLSDGSSQSSTGRVARHHARQPMSFASSFGSSAPGGGQSQQQQHRSSAAAASRPSSQTRAQSRHGSPPNGPSYPPIASKTTADGFPSSLAAGAARLPPSLSRSPPPARAPNVSWGSPSFSPFGHDIPNA